MSNETKRAAQNIYRLRNDSVRFVEHFFGVTPDDWQAEALRAVDDGYSVAARSGHGVGKTTTLSWIVLQTVATYPFCKVPCTAPTQHQLSDLLWAEIAYWLNRSKALKSMINWTATKCAVSGHEDAWFAVARSCRVPENLAGFHAKKLRYVVDEASGVPDIIFQVVDGALTTPGAQIIMAGNPTQRSGYFYDAFHKARGQYKCLRVSSEDSKRVSSKYAEDMARKWGKDSDVYRVRVLGDFPLAESAGFIPIDIVESAVTRYTDATGYGDCELGIDVARFGDDETCFVIRQGYKVLLIESHRGWSTTRTTGRAVQLINEYKCISVKIDDTGVGGAVSDNLYEQINETHEAMVIPINFGGAGDEHYDNFSAVMWGGIRDLLKSNDLALPDDDDLIAQLTTRRYVLTSKGKIRLERKEDMKHRGLPSPDKADAVALAFAYGDAYCEAMTGSTKREATRL